MSLQKHPALNKLRVIDRHRVVAYSIQMEVHFVFQAHSDMGNRPAEFTCHLYDSASLNYNAYITPDTFVPGSTGVRGTSCESARTLDELVHALDWAHLPSELAQLRALLSTCQATNDGSLLGDLVLRQRSPEQASQLQERLESQAQQLMTAERGRITQSMEQALDDAVKAATTAARFGLRPQLLLDKDRIAQLPSRT